MVQRLRHRYTHVKHFRLHTDRQPVPAISPRQGYAPVLDPGTAHHEVATLLHRHDPDNTPHVRAAARPGLVLHQDEELASTGMLLATAVDVAPITVEVHYNCSRTL